MMSRRIRNRHTAHCKLVLASDTARVLQSHPGVSHRPTSSKVAAIFYTEGEIHDADFVFYRWNKTEAVQLEFPC